LLCLLVRCGRDQGSEQKKDAHLLSIFLQIVEWCFCIKALGVLSYSRTRLEDVFDEFAPEKYDFQFQQTRVLVKLLRQDYVSRSEAKRLLHGLDKFSEIELDMRDVRHVGQGFADEIYRVFAGAHPDIVIRIINASGAIDAMLRHVHVD